jgi:hypothetical protein
MWVLVLVYIYLSTNIDRACMFFLAVESFKGSILRMYIEDFEKMGRSIPDGLTYVTS